MLKYLLDFLMDEDGKFNLDFSYKQQLLVIKSIPVAMMEKNEYYNLYKPVTGTLMPSGHGDTPTTLEAANERAGTCDVIMTTPLPM